MLTERAGASRLGPTLTLHSPPTSLEKPLHLIGIEGEPEEEFTVVAVGVEKSSINFGLR
jgi:hypothetical protein